MRFLVERASTWDKHEMRDFATLEALLQWVTDIKNDDENVDGIIIDRISSDGHRSQVANDLGGAGWAIIIYDSYIE